MRKDNLEFIKHTEPHVSSIVRPTFSLFSADKKRRGKIQHGIQNQFRLISSHIVLFQCSVYFDIDIEAIRTCTETLKGSQLLQSHGNRTMTAQNPLSFVPSIEIDKVNIELLADVAAFKLFYFFIYRTLTPAEQYKINLCITLKKSLTTTTKKSLTLIWSQIFDNRTYFLTRCLLISCVVTIFNHVLRLTS